MSSGVGYSIFKPCGLGDKPGGRSHITTGHDDTLMKNILFHEISRADVAHIMTTALLGRYTGLRVDLCSRPGEAQKDLNAVLEGARWPFETARGH